MADERVRLAGALVDRYRITRELGQAGMATVYLAEDINHGRKVAARTWIQPGWFPRVGLEEGRQRTITALRLEHALP
jgi:ABC-type cobalamin transport system ATPase subunit